jgi:hypothetical protein
MAENLNENHKEKVFNRSAVSRLLMRQPVSRGFLNIHQNREKEIVDLLDGCEKLGDNSLLV